MATKSHAYTLGFSGESVPLFAWVKRTFFGERDHLSALRRGVVTLGADEFAQFEECMNKPKAPTATMVEAARRHRQSRNS